MVQNMLERRAVNEVTQEIEQDEEERPIKAESKDKTTDFIKRLKFAQIYYKK